MKKTSYTLSAFLFILTLIIASCDKEEDQQQSVNCLAVGTWSLSYLSIEYNNNIQCVYSCNGSNQLPLNCIVSGPFYAGCVRLTVTENRSYIISDQDGWSTSGNWIGNCGIGEQIVVNYDGDTETGLVTSLSANELKIQLIDDDDGTVIYHFIK